MSQYISIIVPNYNHAFYLRKRLDSILNQTYTDFEVIILDDCSTDNSREIIETYKNDEHVSHIVYNNENCGSPFVQWQRGIELSKGDWIWIAESDDWAETNFLAELTHHIDNNNSIIYCNSVLEFDSRSIVPSSDLSVVAYDGITFIKSKMLYDNAIYNASSAIFSKKAYQSISDEYTGYNAVGDKLFWILLCEQGNVVFDSKPLNHFRRHSNSTSITAENDGSLFYEEYRIYKRNSKQPYFTINDRIHTINHYIDWISRNKYLNPNTKNTLYELWQKELPNKLTLHIYRLFKIIKKIL